MSPGRKRGQIMVVAALHTLCIPGGVPRGVPIPVGVLGVWEHSGAGGGGCCGLTPGVSYQAAGAQSCFGERVGFVCSLLSCVEEEKLLLAASRTQQPDTVREGCPRSGSQAGVTLRWQLWPSLPLEAFGSLCQTPASPSRVLSLQDLHSVGLSGLKALATHGHESPVGWVVARLWLVALTELSLVLLARAAVTRTAS